MTFKMIPDPEEDEDYARWLLMQPWGQQPAFAPPSDDPRQHPIANEPRPETSPAYGDAGRPRLARPDEQPPEDWEPPGPSPMLASRKRAPSQAPARSSAPSSATTQIGESGGLGDDGTLMLALFADALINRGRGTADILKMFGGDPDRELNRRYKEAQIESLKRGGRGLTPEQIALQERRLAQGDRRLDNQEENTRLSSARQLFTEAKWSALNTVGSPQQRAMVEFGVANGIPRNQIEQLTAEQAEKTFPAINEHLKSTGDIGAARTQHDVDTATALVGPKAQTARAVSAATLPDDIVRAQAGAGIHVDAAAENDARKLRIATAGASAKLKALRRRAESRDPSEKLPLQEGIVNEWLTKGTARLAGGSGMSAEDTNLLRAIESAALGAYIVDAGNAPNTDPERATAFGKFLSDGTVGGLLDVIDEELLILEEKLAAQESAINASRLSAPGRNGPARPRARNVPKSLEGL